MGHGIGYFLLGLAVLYALSAPSRWSPPMSFLLYSLYRFTDEFHQLFIPGDSASARDILIDSLASLSGVTVMLRVEAIGNLKRGVSG